MGDLHSNNYQFSFHLKIINCGLQIKYFLNLRTSEIHLFYNLQLFYWHFLEFLWLFIFQVFYTLFFIPSMDWYTSDIGRISKRQLSDMGLTFLFLVITYLCLLVVGRHLDS